MPILRFPTDISKLQIIKVSIPIFFSNLAIPLVGIVDTGLMGNLDNEKYLIAVSISTAFLTMVLWSFGFLRMGTVGIVSQALGKGDYRELVNTIIRNLFVALLIAFIIILLKPLIINLIYNLFVTSEQTKILIDRYISIRIFSAPAELIIYILVGFYPGIQKTFISSSLIIILSVLNIVLSIYFVHYLQIDVAGVALGTLAASYLTVISYSIFTYYYIIKKFKVIPRIYKKILNGKKMIRLLNINFDIFLRTVLLTFAFFWVTYLSSTLGEEYVAINSILLQFIIIAAFFLDAYAFSTEGIVGYSIGRKSLRMFNSVVKNSIYLSFFTGLTISVVFIFFSEHVINIITSIEYLRYLSYKYIFWIILIPPIASFCYQLDGIFLGATQTAEIRNSMFISVIIYLPASIFLTEQLLNYGIWFSLLIFMILRASTLHFYFSRILKKFK